MSAKSGRIVLLYSLFLIAVAGSLLAAEAGDVVINEMFCDPTTYFDMSEYIELYNTTDLAIDLSGWVLTGIEYDEICQEHHHQIPSGTTIPAHGYLIIARDVRDVSADSAGFEQRFGFLPDLEMYDSNQSFEYDDPRVPNTICQNPDAYDDQIRLIPGRSDYGGSCPEGTLKFNYEALWLFADPSRTQLIDVVEYKDPYWCQTDHCTGIGASDNDAFADFPEEDTGVSIGRDANSTDTDISNVDLYLQVATPGARNNVNVPPDIYGLAYSPCVPYETDDVTISCYIKDPDGVQWAWCYYSFDGAPYDSVAMSAPPSDSLYSADLSAQPLGTQARFFVKAADDSGLVKMHPDTTRSNPYRYSVGMTLISQVQFAAIGGTDTSSYIGQAVNVSGVVTASRGVYANQGVFVIQDGQGPFSGVHVFDPTYSVDAQEGDSVTVSGFVSEYSGLTEIYMFVGCYTEHGPGTVPAPTVVTTGTISTSSTLAERYEGVLVRVNNVSVTNDDLGYGEWEVNDGSGAAIVDDAAYYAYEPLTGDPLAAVIGVLDHYRITTYEGYRIEPRRSADIIGPPSIWSVVYSPIPPTSSGPVTVSATVKDYSFNITSVKVFYSTNDGATWDSTAMASPDSVYTAGIGPFPNGTTVDYYVEAWNDGGYVGHKPVVGSYDLYVGTLTISQVQGNFKPGGTDSSFYAGTPVNVSGIVTAAPGEYSPNYFFIQNSYSGAETPAYRGIKVYDRTGTLNLSRGDSVTVCGDVWEYFLETELAMHFSGAIAVHTSGNAVPAPYALSTALIPSESWEGVLVAADGATVKSVPDQYGEWKITNATAADTCRVGDQGTYIYDPLVNDLVNVHGIEMYAYGVYTLEPRDDDDICEPSEAGVGDGSRPARLALAISPNPVTSGADIMMAIPVTGQVSLKIYDVQGRQVSTLLDGRVTAGEHGVHWSGVNADGAKVASGIYFMKLENGRSSLVRKMVISR
jgi:hypothetical protein